MPALPFPVAEVLPANYILQINFPTTQAGSEDAQLLLIESVFGSHE